MKTITKRELIERLAEQHGFKRAVIKRLIQSLLNEIVEELSRGNRLEFRDFGVFESKIRAARMAQNPKTLERVRVPAKRTVKFKVGRVMRQRLLDTPATVDAATGLPLEHAGQPSTRARRADSDGRPPRT